MSVRQCRLSPHIARHVPMFTDYVPHITDYVPIISECLRLCADCLGSVQSSVTPQGTTNPPEWPVLAESVSGRALIPGTVSGDCGRLWRVPAFGHALPGIRSPILRVGRQVPAFTRNHPGKATLKSARKPQ